jgi:hypothetical protein
VPSVTAFDFIGAVELGISRRSHHRPESSLYYWLCSASARWAAPGLFLLSHRLSSNSLIPSQIDPITMAVPPTSNARNNFHPITYAVKPKIPIKGQVMRSTPIRFRSFLVADCSCLRSVPLMAYSLPVPTLSISQGIAAGRHHCLLTAFQSAP